ncbi:Nck-associated protein 5 [Camelus dromedarius]|uniref:Nck-associated protein 5 n=1 Tax=Camelus dromedarius TaxID=9838 RepID=A0A5N4E556_CAMDR|nr:Nck-associated protein 5 [Camelus dromedarius]
MHECQLNAKPSTSALKCPGLAVAIPGHLCPRNSCSSSELSLSSTCSEYSSGSSYTWHDGKNLRKRQSSQNWDKRLSIDSSLPSGFASPTDELPPTRIKESHILEGLRKLQKQKLLLEPPSVITKWGYKDCMNSNEGIYSPGIKSSSLKEYPPCKPMDTGSPCKEPHKAFVYDTDSHDDADEDPSSRAALPALPNQGCGLHCCQLTHSVSDGLFGWEPNGKRCSEGTSSVCPRERPEKLTSCASNCPLEQKLCPGVPVPQVQRERGPHGQGRLALSVQLSDTDDSETLDELHIESSDGKSPSDVSLTADTDKSMENLDILLGLGRSQRGSPEEQEKQVPVPLESRPKTFSFIKQQRLVKRTSSEERITVVFDAEDGEPIEFSSHQTGTVTVTRNEISINQAPARPQAEHTELLPQGIAHFQSGAAAKDYPFFKRSEEEIEENIPKAELLRKSSTVPGKHEKDSLNEASKSSVAMNKAKPEASRIPTGLDTTGDERNVSPLDLQAPGSLAEGPPPETAMPESLVNSMPGADGKDRVENKSGKRSLSSKPHLKPALGMNGAKARSQSLSAHAGDKPPTPPMEGGPGKVRTQIITNTAERGNSLTRQSSSASTEGAPDKTASALTSDSLPGAGRPLGHPSSGHGSLGSTGSSSSQQGSPSKLPLKIPPKSEGPLTPPGTEEPQASAQGESPRVTGPGEPGSDRCGCPPTPTDGPRVPQSPGRSRYPSSLEPSRTSKLETSGRFPDTSTTRTSVVSPEAPLSPTIEEKVMLCIQENVEKGQVQTKSTSVEAKPKPGPSFASWFGFRRSRLPALSSRKMDVSKTKAEKKDVKGLGFGNKQLKSERRKEKKKPELQCEMENELNRDIELADGPDSGLQGRSNLKTPPDIFEQMKLESRNRPSPVPCSTKDTFMTELLNRVDKKAAQQTESGSNNVSCRSVLKGSSQGSCLTGSSISTQGSHKKNIKTRADMEIPKGSLIKEASEHLQEDEEDTAADSAFQSHSIGKNACLHMSLNEMFSTCDLISDTACF